MKHRSKILSTKGGTGRTRLSQIDQKPADGGYMRKETETPNGFEAFTINDEVDTSDLFEQEAVELEQAPLYCEGVYPPASVEIVDREESAAYGNIKPPTNPAPTSMPNAEEADDSLANRETDAVEETASTDLLSAEQIEEMKLNYRDALYALRVMDDALEPATTAYNEQKEALHKAYLETNAEKLALQSKALEAVSEWDAKLRAAAIAHFDATKEKTLDENLSVRVVSSLIYPMEKAVEWAEKEAPYMIKKAVDPKKFDVAVIDMGLEFVEVKDKVTAVIKGLK